MAATPNSNYSSSPSPSPTTHNPAEWETRSQWRFCSMGEGTTYIPLYQTPPQPPSTQSRPKWNKAFASTGGRMHTPGLYDEESNDEIPDITTLRVTDDDEEDSFHSPPPSQPQPQPTTQTPHQSRTEKRFKKMADIGKEIHPHHLALGWMFLGIELRKSPVAQILRTGFNLKPSLEEVFEIESQLATEFNQVMRLFQLNNGRDQLCFVSFMRDLLEIPDLAMIRMRRVLAECKCCELHQSRRPLCQEKKRQPDYDMFAQPVNDCKCICRHFMRKLEEALLGEYHLEINGQLWERSL
jgi:hypothetical protein